MKNNINIFCNFFTKKWISYISKNDIDFVPTLIEKNKTDEKNNQKMLAFDFPPFKYKGCINEAKPKTRRIFEICFSIDLCPLWWFCLNVVVSFTSTEKGFFNV